MRTAGVREARQNLSALLDEVKKGREVVITEHGRPVAKLVPPDRPRGKGVPALARRVRHAEVTPEAARRVQHALVVGLDDGVYQRVELTPGVHRQAEHFLSSLTETPLRAADALHLALATSARAASLASFDRRLSAAARALGLATYPARVGSPP